MTCKRRSLALALVLSVGAAGCSTVRSSSVAASAGQAGASPYAGRVTIRATEVPEGAEELGIVEAHATRFAEFPELIAQFGREAAAVGGNFAKIDGIQTKFEMVTTVQTVSYQCGKSTCTSSQPVTEEVGTTTVQGRAFRVP